MPVLVKVAFTHYSPKGSEDGFKEYVIARDLEQAVEYIDAEYMYGALKDFDDPDEHDEGSIWAHDKWRQSKLDEARRMGLRISEDNDVEGGKRLLSFWYGGTDWQDIEGAYHGVTQWHWRDHREVDDIEAATIIGTGLVKDIRDYKAKER